MNENQYWIGIFSALGQLCIENRCNAWKLKWSHGLWENQCYHTISVNLLWKTCSYVGTTAVCVFTSGVMVLGDVRTETNLNIESRQVLLWYFWQHYFGYRDLDRSSHKSLCHRLWLIMETAFKSNLCHLLARWQQNGAHTVTWFIGKWIENENKSQLMHRPTVIWLGWHSATNMSLFFFFFRRVSKWVRWHPITWAMSLSCDASETEFIWINEVMKEQQATH